MLSKVKYEGETAPFTGLPVSNAELSLLRRQAAKTTRVHVLIRSLSQRPEVQAAMNLYTKRNQAAGISYSIVLCGRKTPLPKNSLTIPNRSLDL
jgi:hypothetical protein